MKKNHARRAAFLAVCLFALCAFPAHAASPKLVPVGLAAGIALETQGARIVGFSEHSPARDAGLMEGDSILYINETKITGASVLSGALAASEGAVEVRIARGEDELLLTVEPDRTKETPRLGVFVRDALAGIGTVTYYDPATGQYGALGHGISEGNEGLMVVGGGKLVSCTLDRIQPGAPGIPGELGGTL
ncbi:MAG: PDZ domain-containing protein, partial [Oscillospiraceae bacterium]|nr:PDZ domain-containing protein [Oscillospiraceae bacterium]